MCILSIFPPFRVDDLNAQYIPLLFSDGKFTFVDHRVVNIMGFTPPELLGKSCFELIHTEDQTHMKDSFDQVIKMKGQVFTFMYR